MTGRPPAGLSGSRSVTARAGVADYNSAMFRPLFTALAAPFAAPLAAPLGAILLAASCACSTAAPLRVGGFVVAPLVLGEPGRPLRGALREFLEREVTPAGVSMQWMPPTSLARAYASLDDGSLDVVLVASGEAARLPGARPFGWTFLKTRPHLAVRDDSPLRTVRSLDQIAGMDIGWVAGPSLSPGLRRSGARWQRAASPNWQMENLQRLQAGTIDAAYFENEYSPYYLARKAGIPIRLVRLPMPPRAFFMLYSLKADKADIARFDRAAGAAFAGRHFQDYLERYDSPGGPSPR